MELFTNLIIVDFPQPNSSLILSIVIPDDNCNIAIENYLSIERTLLFIVVENEYYITPCFKSSFIVLQRF